MHSNTVITNEPAVEHDQQGHPEHGGRVTAVLQHLVQTGVAADLDALANEPPSLTHILRAHTSDHIALVEYVSNRGGGMIGPDTYVTAATYEAALRAASACTTAVDGILSGHFRNGMALVRPPGHHAGTSTIEGFCLINNVAVAARHAQQFADVRRIAIVDFDVHHGNGTQNIFETDPSVLFISSHMFGMGFYPGSGHVREIGKGGGRGSTMNLPLPPGTGDVGYARLFEQIIRPKIAAFNPDMLLVSVGFDAHWQDPLARAGLSLTGYAHLCRQLVNWAEAFCDGRLLFVLEGGYRLDALAHGVENLAYALLGQDKISDPLGPTMYGDGPDSADLERTLRELHRL